MGDKSAKLSVDVVANTRQAQTELDGFSSKVAGFAAGVTAAFTTFAIDKVVQGATWAADELVDAVGNAAALNAALATTEQIYGAATDRVTAWAAGAAKALGLSKVQALTTARSFAVYGKQIGLTGNELAGFSEDVTQLAADLGAFNDVPTADAVQMIGSAFRGERDPIERLGVVLNDATVKAAYFAATGEQVTGVLTPQQNVIGTLAAITQQAADATGQYARESDQLQGQQQETAATWENMTAALGEKLLPVVTAFTTWVNDKLLPALSDLGTWWDTSPMAQKIRDVASAIAEKLQTAADDLVEWWNEPGGGKETFDSFVGAVETLEPKLRDLWRSLKDLKSQLDEVFGVFGGLTGMLKGQFSMTLLNVYLLMEAVTAVARLLVWFVSGLVAQFQQLWQALSIVAKWLGDVVDLAKDFIGLGGGWLGNLGGLVGSIPGVGRSAAGGPATFAAGAGSPTYVLNATVNVPMGAYAGDVGAAIVAELDAWAARNGALPARLTGGPS